MPRWIVRIVLLALLALPVSVASIAAAQAAPGTALPASAPRLVTTDPGPPADCSQLWGVGKTLCEMNNKKSCVIYPTNPLCAVAGQPSNPITGVIDNALNSTIVKPMATGLAQFDVQILQDGVAAWLTQKSVSIKDSGVLSSSTGTVNGQPVTYSLEALCLGIGEMIAVILVMWQGIRVMIQRKGAPLMEAVTGLVINTFVTLVGVALIDGLLVLSDTLTADIIDVPFHGDGQLAARMAKVLLATDGFNPMAQLVMGLVVLVVAVSQAVLMFLRQAAIPVQALLLPIAGAGQMGGQSTRQWLPRLWTSMITIIVYKPLAALLIAAGFVEITHGVGTADWIRGVVTLVLSVLALGALMKLFAPLGVQMAGATSGGFSNALAGAAMLPQLASRGGGGGSDGNASPTSAVQHAQQMATRGPGAAAAVGVSAVQHAANVSTDAMAGPDGTDRNTSSVPQQAGRPGRDAAPSNGTPGTGSNTATPAAAPTSPGVTVAMRGAEAVSRSASGAGNTMSEGSKNQ